MDGAKSTLGTPLPPLPPPPPELKRVPLPAMLAGGLFLFAASVPRSRREFASELLGLAQQALRSDPTVSMELGMGVEAGGVYASSSGRALVEGGRGSGGAARTRTWEQLVLQFQITGGNAWAQGVAYGVREVGWRGGGAGDGDNDGDGGQVHLLALEVANMDAVLNGESFQVPMTVAIQHVDEDTTVASRDA